MATSEEPATIKEAVKFLEKKFGDGIIHDMSKREIVPIDVVSTGVLNLDCELGIGGLPRGRLTELYGPEGAGKTTLLQHVIAEVNKLGEKALLVDVEHRFDMAYAKKCGVGGDELFFISQPNTAEDALNIIEYCVKSKLFSLISLDSIAALVPEREVQGEMGEQAVGLLPKLVTQACRKLGPIIHSSNTIVIFTNQVREKMNVSSPYASHETTPGGRGLRHTSSIRIRLGRDDYVKQGEEKIGIVTKATIVKNGCGRPYGEVKFKILSEGIDRVGAILEAAVDYGIVKRKSGGHHAYGDINLGQGADNTVIPFLRNTPELLAEIESKVRAVALPHFMPSSV